MKRLQLNIMSSFLAEAQKHPTMYAAIFFWRVITSSTGLQDSVHVMVHAW